MKKFIITVGFIILCLILVFSATVGISTTASNNNKRLIDSLSQELTAFRVEYNKNVGFSKDSIIVDINVKPQVIKIFNQCTD